MRECVLSLLCFLCRHPSSSPVCAGSYHTTSQHGWIKTQNFTSVVLVWAIWVWFQDQMALRCIYILYTYGIFLISTFQRQSSSVCFWLCSTLWLPRECLEKLMHSFLLVDVLYLQQHTGKKQQKKKAGKAERQIVENCPWVCLRLRSRGLLHKYICFLIICAFGKGTFTLCTPTDERANQ